MYNYFNLTLFQVLTHSTEMYISRISVTNETTWSLLYKMIKHILTVIQLRSTD